MPGGGAWGATGRPDRGPLAAQPECRGLRAIPALGCGVFPWVSELVNQSKLLEVRVLGRSSLDHSLGSQGASL